MAKEQSNRPHRHRQLDAAVCQEMTLWSLGGTTSHLSRTLWAQRDTAHVTVRPVREPIMPEVASTMRAENVKAFTWSSELHRRQPARRSWPEGGGSRGPDRPELPSGVRVRRKNPVIFFLTGGGGGGARQRLMTNSPGPLLNLQSRLRRCRQPVRPICWAVLGGSKGRGCNYTPDFGFAPLVWHATTLFVTMIVIIYQQYPISSNSIEELSTSQGRW